MEEMMYGYYRLNRWRNIVKRLFARSTLHNVWSIYRTVYGRREMKLEEYNVFSVILGSNPTSGSYTQRMDPFSTHTFGISPLCVGHFASCAAGVV